MDIINVGFLTEGWGIDKVNNGVQEDPREDTIEIDITVSEALDIIKAVKSALSRPEAVQFINRRLLQRFVSGLEQEITDKKSIRN